MKKLCEFNEKQVCRNCGYVSRFSNLYRECRPEAASGKIVRYVPPPSVQDLGKAPWVNIGNCVEQLLKVVGVTEKRISWLIGRNCGCTARKARWNAWGHAIQFRIELAIAIARQSIKAAVRGRSTGQDAREAGNS